MQRSTPATPAPGTRKLLRVGTDRMAPRYRAGETIALQYVTPADGDHVWIELKPAQGETRGPAMLRLLRKQTRSTLTVVHYQPSEQVTKIKRCKMSAIYRVLSTDDMLRLLGAKI